MGIEKNLRINARQLHIIEYYITTGKNIIAWIKMEPVVIAEIQKRASKAALKEFKTATFVPKMARSRKTAIDKMLLAYKEDHPDFRYIVRNGEEDLKILIKRISEGSYLPYRNLPIQVLGAISPLKTNIKGSPVAGAENGENHKGSPEAGAENGEN